MGNPTNHKNHTNHSSDNSLRALSVLRGQSPSFRPPHTVIPAAAGIQRGGAAGHPTNHKNHSSDNPLRALRGQSPSFRPPHPSFRRRPESRGAGTWGIPLITKITRITVQTTPFAPLVSFVDNPRHSNRPPVIPAAAGIQRGGDVGNPTNHKNHTNHSSDNSLRALSVLRGQSPSFRPPHTVIPAAAGIQRGEDVGNPTNHSSDNSLRAPSCPSWIIPVIPTAHPSFRRRPESRGGDVGNHKNHTNHTNHSSDNPPSRPLVSFVDNPRHSNRPPVIPAAAGIQRGEAAGHPTNHKNHSSDNPLRAP